MAVPKLRERLSSIAGGIKGAAALVAAIVTLGGAIGWILTHVSSHQQSNLSKESNRLQQLRAGITFMRFQDILGQQPDARASVDDPDGITLRQHRAVRFIFVRRYDYLQAVVSGDGTVLGFSIVARSRNLHPRFRWFGKYIVLNKTVLSAVPAERIGGFCGASRAQYFVAGGGANSANAQELAVGIVSMGSNSSQLDEAFCPNWEKLSSCHIDNGAYLNALLTSHGDECFLGSSAGKQASGMVMNAYAESASAIPMSSDLLAPGEAEVAAADGGAP